MWTKLVLLILVIVPAGCGTTQAYQRGRLAKPKMQLEPDPDAAILEQHVYEYREGSAGGYGGGGWRVRLQLNAVAIAVGIMLSARFSAAQSLARIDSRASVYQDSDYTNITTNNIAARTTPTEHLGVDGRYLVDVISSASIDVVTAATGRFHDVRHEIEGGANYRDDYRRISASYIYSVENDWKSHTGNAGFVQDLVRHDVTLKGGGTFVANEVGRRDDPNFSERLTVVGGNVGITFVLGENDLVDVGYTASYLDGYQERPYRFVYFGGTAPSPLPPAQREEVPERRFRNSLTLRWNHHLFADTALRSHARGYLDDWGVRSVTTGTEYVVGFGEIETALFIRGYAQQHADFYAPQYAERKRYMTADRELATFVDAFGGGRIGWRKENVGVFEDIHAEAKVTGFAFHFIDFPRLRERTGIIGEVAVGGGVLMGTKHMVVIAIVALFGCQEGLEDPKPLTSLDEPYFRCKVQPILTKSCSTFACHGDARRYYRVFARNRLRVRGSEKERNAALTALERASNFDASRAVVDMNAPRESLLLSKPLDIQAGGSFHRGAELFNGGDVFIDRNDPDFKTLEAWTRGAKEDPACIEPGSDQ